MGTHDRCDVSTVVSPDLGLRVCTYLASDWLRAKTRTDDWLKDAKSLEESAEKHSWLAQRRTLGSLTWTGGRIPKGLRGAGENSTRLSEEDVPGLLPGPQV